MQTGTKISALAHGLLLGWAFLGGVFETDPLPFEVQDVSVISAEDFALMTGRSRTPEIDAAPVEPEPPLSNATPDVTVEPDSPPARSPPARSPPAHSPSAQSPAARSPLARSPPAHSPPSLMHRRSPSGERTQEPSVGRCGGRRVIICRCEA